MTNKCYFWFLGTFLPVSLLFKLVFHKSLLGESRQTRKMGLWSFSARSFIEYQLD